MRTPHSNCLYNTQSTRFFVILLLIFLLFSVLQPAQFAQAKPAPAITPLATATPGPNITIDVGGSHFTVNNSGDDMTADYSYLITQDGSTIQSGTFRYAHGGSQIYSVTGEGDFVLYIKDDLGADLINASLSIHLPNISAVGSVVSGTATFVITNSGGDMPAAYTYVVKDSGGSVVKTGMFQLHSGESQSASVSGILGVLTLSITDDKGTTTVAATVTVAPASTETVTVIATSTSAPTSTNKPVYGIVPSETPANLVWFWYTSTPTSTPTPTITVTPSSTLIPSLIPDTSTATITQTLEQIMTQTSILPASVPEEEPRNAIPVWVLLLGSILLLGLIVFWFFRLRKK